MSHLTPAQAKVVTLVHTGLTNPVIARTLNLSLSTVKNHLNAIYRKGGDTGPVNRTELREACEKGTLGAFTYHSGR